MDPAATAEAEQVAARLGVAAAEAAVAVAYGHAAWRMLGEAHTFLLVGGPEAEVELARILRDRPDGEPAAKAYLGAHKP